jgi:hypothetical protein
MLEVSSKVTLWFDVVNSPSLSPEQKDLIMLRLKTRTGKDGGPSRHIVTDPGPGKRQSCKKASEYLQHQLPVAGGQSHHLGPVGYRGFGWCASHSSTYLASLSRKPECLHF